MTRDKCKHEVKNTDCICVKCGACMIDGCDGDETNCSHMADVKKYEESNKELVEIEVVLNSSWKKAWDNHKNMNRVDRFKDVATAFQSYMEKKVLEGRKEGIKMASEIANSYNSCTTHPYMIGDCILGKLNVLKGKIRKNKQKLKEQEKGDG